MTRWVYAALALLAVVVGAAAISQSAVPTVESLDARVCALEDAVFAEPCVSPTTAPPPTTTTTPAPTTTTTAPPTTTTTTTTTLPPAPGFPTRQEALARTNVVVVSGARSTQYRVGSPPPDATYDLRGMTSTAYPQGHAFPVSIGRDTAGARTVVIGGSVIGTQVRTLTWDQVHAFGGAGMTLRGSDYQVSYDFRADNQHDGIQMLPPADANASRYLVEGAYMTWIRDDAIEADDEMSGTIRDVLVESANNAVSFGQSTKNPAAVTDISDSIFILVPMRNDRAADGLGHQALFKQAPGGRVNMTNVTVCLTENPMTSGRTTIRPAGVWTNVTYVLGAGWTGPDPVIAGVTISHAWQSRCVDAATAWRAAH